jgi:elongator complex protein 1
VTTTLYRDTKQVLKARHLDASQDFRSDTEPTLPSGSKVNRVCDAILQSLHSRKGASLQNIITTNLCKNPPALDDALSVAAGIMAAAGEDAAERVVEHICFLADANKAYDHALGLYNLELTTLVAQQSQRDPREYLPFLQDLHRLPEFRRRFVIDDHLERWEKAVTHLKELDTFDEFCTYTTKHKLFQLALRLYRYNDDRLRRLSGLYAIHLESISDFKQAGLMYESLGNHSKAVDCYRAAGFRCWRECLGAAQLQSPPIGQQALLDLATALADAVFEAKDYLAAATIQLDYLSLPADSVRSLCRGYHFAEAIRMASMNAQLDQDLLITIFDPCLLDALSSSTEFLADCRGQLQAQVPRVLDLRRRAIEDPLAFYEGERPTRNGEDIPDDISVVSDAASRMSTSASLFTRYTGKDGSIGTLASNASRASSKNRKREEKKRARGRKGTVYEEDYLVNSVRRLVERVDATRDEVERLVVALMRRGMAERARAVEALMAEVLDGCKAAVAELWPAPSRNRQQSEDEPVPGSHNSNGVEAKQHEETRDARPPPVVSDFARLSLLG